MKELLEMFLRSKVGTNWNEYVLNNVYEPDVIETIEVTEDSINIDGHVVQFEFSYIDESGDRIYYTATTSVWFVMVALNNKIDNLNE